MAEQFVNQGGAANSDPSRLARWITSRLLRSLASEQRLGHQRAKLERQRRKFGQRHVVEYFHQVEDGYSYLAAQLLQRLAARYDIELVCHLVGAPKGKNAPEPELLLQLSRVDAAAVAPHYGLAFPAAAAAPDPKQVEQARRILALPSAARFVELASLVGAALWQGDAATLQSLASKYGSEDAAATEACVSAGNSRRHELKHYSGAMFYYAGEWYWGVDRLYHLEQRLRELGADKLPQDDLLAPRPAIEMPQLQDNGSLTLEVYASLRSPYTSIIFDKAVQLAGSSGVKLAVRPVLPMVMRGVPATREKGFYIFSDCAREARALGLQWGNLYDPIGEPARRCYSLYPWACEQGRGTELLSAFLKAAFFDGVNTNTDRGMKTVVKNAGLNWEQAKTHIGKPGWETELEANRLAMYDFGCWGVPSFRLLDESGVQVLALWGQDRLWLFAREIQRLLQQRATS